MTVWKNRALPKSIHFYFKDDLTRKEYSVRNQTFFSTFGGPTFPSLGCPERRKETFERIQWDEEKRPSIDSMVAAGFYAVGEDNANCYYCGEGFTDWKKETNPVEEHRYHYYTCVLSKLNLDKTDTVQHKEIDDMNESELRKEVGELREKQKCSICPDNALDACYAIVSCGHRFCKNCIPRLVKCAICRAHVLEVLRIW